MELIRPSGRLTEGSQGLMGRSWRPLGALLEASWTSLGPLWRPLGDQKVAQRRPKRVPNRVQEVTGAQNTISSKTIVFQWISMIFQVLGDALEASECSWRPLGALLRPLGAFLRPLEASWRPLESVLCLPEEVLEASGARSSRHSACLMDPGEGQELRELRFFRLTTRFWAQGGRITGWGNST